MNKQPYSYEWKVQGEARENREKGLPTPDPHMDGGTGVKTIVYNTKKDSKEGTQEKRLEKGKREREREQKVEEIQQ